MTESLLYIGLAPQGPGATPQGPAPSQIQKYYP